MLLNLACSALQKWLFQEQRAWLLPTVRATRPLYLFGTTSLLSQEAAGMWLTVCTLWRSLTHPQQQHRQHLPRNIVRAVYIFAASCFQIVIVSNTLKTNQQTHVQQWIVFVVAGSRYASMITGLRGRTGSRGKSSNSGRGARSDSLGSPTPGSSCDRVCAYVCPVWENMPCVVSLPFMYVFCGQYLNDSMYCAACRALPWHATTCRGILLHYVSCLSIR